MRRVVAVSFVICTLALSAWVAWRELGSTQPRYVELGNLVVLVLTLIVLVWYAYDTNTIARVTQERWLRDGVLNTTYNLQLVGQKGDRGKTLVQLTNASNLVVRARTTFNFKIYGHPVTAGALYDGGENWLLFPHQLSQGWFEIEALAENKGKTVTTLISESTPDNRKSQVTMDLELEFWDELGERRKFPARHHYFDFGRWAWIPQLAERRAA
jgi:hypothetical protein